MRAGTKQIVQGGRLEREGLWYPQEVSAEGKGNSQQAFYCRAGDETGGLDLKEQKEKRGSAVSLHASLASEPYFSKAGRQYKNVQSTANNALKIIFLNSP